MKKHLDYKAPGRKLLRIDLETENNIIKDIKITGDFFMHPEESIFAVENALLGKNIKNPKSVTDSIDRVLREKNIKVMGFNSSDILTALRMDRKIKVAIAQIDIVSGDKDANLNKIEDYAARAARKKADIVCFPEYFTTGGIFNRFGELAEIIPGKTTKKLGKIAKQNNISIVGSVVEKENNTLYNTGIFIDSKGEIAGKHRKIHLFLDEKNAVDRGKTCGCMSTDYGRLGMMVCYDTIFPEVSRQLAVRGAEIIFIPANWPRPFSAQWKIASSARALDNQVWTVAVNRCGADSQFNYFGNSRIVSPYGEAVVECGECEELVFFDIEPHKSVEFRNTVDFLNDREK